MDKFRDLKNLSNKINFKKVGNFLVAEKENELTKKVFITTVDAQSFVINFESSGALICSMRVKSLAGAKEEARKFLRGKE